jgi:alpha/beta superfamily hydrolase
MLETDDGETLEAQRSVPDGARVCVVLAHPHPLYGGTMWDGPPAVLFERLPGEGVGAIRFNFRGAGRSSGEHDRGDAERLDIRAAMGAVPDDLPVVLCGYSFGADVCLGVDDPRVLAWCAIAPPLMGALSAGDATRPKLVLAAEHDAHFPPDRARDLVSDWTATTVEVVPGTDHFLGGALGRIADRVAAFVRDVSTGS